MARTAFYQNDNIIEVDKLYDNVADDYVNNATVNVTVKDLDGAEVSGQSWPTQLAYVADSDGKYQATISDSVAFTRDTEYVAELSADGGAGKLAAWSFRFQVRERTAGDF